MAEVILQRLEQRMYSLAKLVMCGKLPEELLSLSNTSIGEVQEPF